MNKLRTNILRHCTGCPCLNSDYEYGSACNLGFLSELVWVDKAHPTVEVSPDVVHKAQSTVEVPSDVAHETRKYDLVQVSDGCELLSILTMRETMRYDETQHRWVKGKA